MNVFLVRHGLARNNMPDPSQCPYDPVFEEIEVAGDTSLSPQGELQATLTGKRLSKIRFDAALVSPFHRTLSTAAGILREQSDRIPMEVMYELVECGGSSNQLMRESLYERIWSDVRLLWPNTLLKDDGETEWIRAERVVAYIKERFQAEENVLIVSHGAFLSRFLIPAFLGMSREQARAVNFGAENCGISMIRFDKGVPAVAMAINETGHLGDAISREPFNVKYG